MKELPKVFANPIDKNLNNNRSFSYGKLEVDQNLKDERKLASKLDNLFGKEFYSIDCLIKFENYEERHTIIGKTSNNLVTKTEKLIPIKEIFDIELAEK